MRSPYSSQIKPIVSSHDADWNGFAVEEWFFPPGEAAVPARDHHFLCFTLGSLARHPSSNGPSFLAQSIEGSRFREHHYNVGEILLLPAGRATHCAWTQNANVLHLLIQPFLLEQAAIDQGLDARNIDLADRFGEYDPFLLHLGLTLREEALANGPNGKAFADSMGNALALHLLRRYSTVASSVSTALKQARKRGLDKNQVRQVSEYVRDQLATPLTLEAAARVVHVSPYHFARQFRAATGQSFHQFVITERIEAAKRLLAHRGDAIPSIAQIATEVGFAHQSHLALHLRRQTGQSPLEFRQEAWR